MKKANANYATCPRCNATIKENTSMFCSKCGGSIGHLHTKHCICGFSAIDVENRTNFCPRCGRSIAEQH